MIRYGKLVRDRIPDQIRARGGTCVVRTMEHDAYVAALAAKLVEEAKEFEASLSVEELADVDEVRRALVRALTTRSHFESVRRTKVKIRGAFAGRVFLESVEDQP